MNTEGSAIKTLFNNTFSPNKTDAMLFFLLWFFLCALTYGTFVPSGLFVPGILMGCGLGQFSGQLYNEVLKYTPDMTDSYVDPDIFAIVAGSGMLVSYTRLTFSIVVIMLETARSVDLFFPVLISVLLSVWVGEIFLPSVYVLAIRGKSIPFIQQEIAPECRGLRSSDIMHKPVVYF
jgi:H+/Cl- antiporter ClcA